ncbi:MAG: ATP-binding protein [Bacteroidales bacterium]|nr:ATP-binding protein [Candidatus Egerieousia equi]
MKEYHKRISDKVLELNLEASGMVLIEGTKWCGKTTTAEQHSASVIYLNDPAQKKAYLQLAQTAPNILLEGKTPRLVDEWQDAAELWDAARFEIDHRDESCGQFIFTGSTTVKKEEREKIRHSGAGRVAWMKMRPMSLFESGESSGSVSLGELFSANIQNAYKSNELDLKQLAFLICRGGWPAALNMSRAAALKQAYNYIDAIVNTDISNVDNVQRDAEFTRRLLRSYARAQASQATISTIHSDLVANEGNALKEETVSSYLTALRKLFVIEDSHAWNPNLRSKAAIRTSDTRYFVDPSIAVAALGLGPDDLISDINTMGLLFETMCVRDLRVYADFLNGEIYHYRDKNGLECDAVIHLKNGSYGLIEIKLGGASLISEGVHTLNKLSEKIDTDKMKAPSFRMVLTGTGSFAYKEPSGVLIVPIGALRP